MMAVLAVPGLLGLMVASFVVALRIKLISRRRHVYTSPIHSIMLGMSGVLMLLMIGGVVFTLYSAVSDKMYCDAKVRSGEYVSQERLFSYNDKAGKNWVGWKDADARCSTNLVRPTHKLPVTESSVIRGFSLQKWFYTIREISLLQF